MHISCLRIFRDDLRATAGLEPGRLEHPDYLVQRRATHWAPAPTVLLLSLALALFRSIRHPIHWGGSAGDGQKYAMELLKLLRWLERIESYIHVRFNAFVGADLHAATNSSLLPSFSEAIMSDTSNAFLKSMEL